MKGRELHQYLSRVARQLEKDEITPQKAIACAKVAGTMINNLQLHLMAARLSGSSATLAAITEFSEAA